MPGLGRSSAATPDSVSLEIDSPVDDVGVVFEDASGLDAQAKFSMELGGVGSEFAEVVAQWVAAVSEPGFDADRDRVALVVQRASQPLLDLARALDRRRQPIAGAPSRAEASALSRLEKLLSNCSADVRDRVLSSAVIMQLELVGPTAAHRLVARELLGAVVDAAAVDDAHALLMDFARGLAARREGRVLDAWLEPLIRLPLRRQPEDTRVARALARRDALARYRAALVDRGERIDLRRLGIDLPPLSLQRPAGALRVEIPVEPGDRPAERELIWALRRRGQAVLLGLPGSGKSTAVDQLAAHWAADDAWPLPIVVSLKQLSAHGLANPMAVVLSLATEGVAPEDAGLLREEFASRIATGNALLLFDGLDECRDLRHRVVIALEQVLKEAHRDTEVLISTRDSAYAAAKTLGLTELKLLLPSDLEITLRALCQEIASWRGIAATERDAWVAQRMREADEAIGRDKSLAETPLLRMLVVYLAARDDRGLPGSRAAVLVEVIRDAVRRLEVMQREDSNLVIGGLDAESSLEAVQQGYTVIAHAVFDEAGVPEPVIETVLAEHCKSVFSLAPGQAVAAARRIRKFWDDAGIFVAAGDEALVSPRVRLLAEIGEAQWVAALAEDEQKAWVRGAVEVNDRHETLLLLAGLSSLSARELIAVASAGGGHATAVLAARALALGADPGPEAIEQLISTLLMPVADDDEQAAYESATALARMAVPDRLRGEVMIAFEQLPPAKAVICKALALTTWDLAGSAWDSAFVDLLSVDPPRGRGWSVDRPFDDALRGAARRLLPGDTETARQLIQASGRGSAGTADFVDKELRRHGYGDLVTERHAELTRSMRNFLKSFEFGHEAWRVLLDTINQGVPQQLTPGQERRLDELADLVVTLEDPENPWDWLVSAAARPQELDSVAHYVIELGGFDRGVIAAQVPLAKDLDADRSVVGFLYDHARERELNRWDAIDDRIQARKDLVTLVQGSELACQVAISALWHCPDRESGVNEVAEILGSLATDQRLMAARFVAGLTPDPERIIRQWLESTDPVLRKVAGWRAGHLAVDQGDGEALRLALTSPDTAARSAAMNPILKARRGDLIEFYVGEMTAAPDEGWVCIWCGASNEPDKYSCDKCNIVGHRLHDQMREISGRAPDVPSLSWDDD